MALIPLYTTAKGVVIGVVKGRKSLYNFRVKYQEPDKRERTPKHIHIIIDLYMKSVGDEKITMQMVDHLTDNVIPKLQPATKFPPTLQVFKAEHIKQFQRLDRYGEYSVEFLLVTAELIQIQEATNYPNGTLNLDLFRLFRNKADIFSVVSAATFR